MHKYKSLLLLLPILFSASCSKIQVPDNISQFLFPIKFEETERTTKEIKVNNKTIIYGKDNKETGKAEYTILASRGQQEDYQYTKIENFSGNQCVYDQSSSLYLAKKESTLTYDATKQCYILTILSTGFVDEEQKKEETKSTQINYTEVDFREQIDMKLFYSTEVEEYKLGGLYYADFFRRNLNAVKYFSIQEDQFVYSVINKPYKQGSQKALISETIKMNHSGLLDSLYVKVVNQDTGDYSIGEMNALYNENIHS